VAQLGDAGADNSGDAKLFVEFTGEGLLGGLAGFDFTAGKLPLETHRLVRSALADENFYTAALIRSLTQDQGGNYQPERLVVAVGVQSANPLFHSGPVSFSVALSLSRIIDHSCLDAREDT